MILDDVLKLIHPEAGELVQHRAFSGNRCRQHDIESRQTVGRNDHEMTFVKLVDIAHLAAAEEALSRDGFG